MYTRLCFVIVDFLKQRRVKIEEKKRSDRKNHVESCRNKIKESSDNTYETPKNIFFNIRSSISYYYLMLHVFNGTSGSKYHGKS